MIGEVFRPQERSKSVIPELDIHCINCIGGIKFVQLIYLMNFWSQDVRVDWAPERVVYKHTEKDR